MKTLKQILALAILSMSSLNAQEITLSFANAKVTNDGMDDYYEADIMLSSTTDFYVGSGQVYIDYNTAAFGENVSSNGNIEYSQPTGSIIGYAFPGFPFPTPAYKDFVENDNTASRVSLSFQQNVALIGLEFAPEIQVVATAKQLFHIKIKYTNVNEDPGICFYSDGVFQDQFFTACGGANIADCTNSPGVQITNDTYDCSGAELSISTTYVYNNDWTPSDPSGVSTGSDEIIIEAGEAAISANTIANTVTINSGAGLTVNISMDLETVSGTTLESTSTTYASLIVDGTITGSIAYERHVNQTGSSGGNDLITPPVSGQSFTDFMANNSNIVSNAGNTLYLFGPFDKTSGTYQTYANTESATLTSGVGYRAATTDNSTLRFEGSVRHGTVNQAVFNSGPSYMEWNLIGNPYPSYMNVQDFLNNTNNMSALDVTNVGIYGYDGDASDGWVIYNLNTTDINTVIAPGQGFFVAVDIDTSIEFTPSMRRHDTSDDFIAGRTEENQHLSIELSNANENTKTDFYFNGNSTNALDPGYDAAVFGNVADAFSIYSHLIEENIGVDMAIQSLPEDVLTNGVIPLGVNTLQGEQLTISIAASNLPQDVDVYLIDTQENQTKDLNISDYVMTPIDDLSGTGRFYISFNQETLGTTETNTNNLKVYTLRTNNQLVIKGIINEPTLAKLYDINGRQVLSKALEVTNNYNTIDTSVLQSGVYMLQLSNNIWYYTEKVIID
ncbi:T9SS type A sorting domain-containing protein [uncultured Winogradskyella sp.]|uniref:T9SS type A sorting domain-containing protein n=1 Tax=uncultured Winogradskyella sp. TaxID=395353 RepID=UPI002611839D|nr:T9SS type A sorting domain-containing protein [uncultured Winogradskyella sp.]